MSNSKNLRAVAWVPGLPHILSPEKSAGYKAINESMRQMQMRFADRGVERILYYSTGWISVLGTSFQSKAELKGNHVDENWHELADLPFSFKVDAPFANKMAAAAGKSGFATAMVDYNGFPVDTGTIVADTLINQGRWRVNMVSSHVYSDFAATKKLGAAMREAIELDGVPTAVVAVSLLSTRYFTQDIKLNEDTIREKSDDQWNRRFLDHLTNGEWEHAEKCVPQFCAEAMPDMGLKALAFLRGVMGTESPKSEVCAYGALYGTGGAVVDAHI
jgi:2-aminophenol/2-amino-5-chlorophenol 1,6-dioxygenase alpha subunit